MEFLHYTYLPVEQRIVSTRVTRPLGYKGHKIHMHDHHELVLVTSQAHCRIVNNGNEVLFSTPCVIVNRAGCFHELVEVSQGDYDSHVLYFLPQILSGLPEEIRFEKELFSADLTAISLSQEQLEQLKPLFDMIEERPYRQQLPLLLTVFAALNQITLEGARTERTAAVGNYIFDVIELLQTDQENWTITQLSQKFHVCQTKLKTDFKRITGIPVMTYKNHIRLEKARLLLESTNIEQAQVAYTCGFSDESYFIRIFKKHYGTTPAAHRKRSR